MRLVASITASSRLILSAGALVAATLAGGALLSAENPQVPSGTWENTGSMSEARSSASATLLPDGRVLVTGGIAASSVSTSAERYSLSADSFLATPPMSQARANHSSTSLADGRVLVTGGTGADGRALASTELYDPEANVWVAAGSLSVARSSHTATRLPDGTVLVAGGDDEGVPNATLEVFDPATETFAAVDGALSAPRTAHAAVGLADGRVLIIGGLGDANVLASVDVYDPTSGLVAPGPSLGISRAGHSGTLLLDGRVLVAGGAGVSGELDSAEIFDPATDAFDAAGSALLAPRQNHLAFLLPHNNAVLIVGGSSGGQAVADAELYVPWQGVNGAFVATGTPGAARAWAAGASLSVPASNTARTGPADGRLLLAGGSASADGSSPMNGAELYGFATVNTDAADYAPGQTVTITGAGWQPFETVSLLLRESPVTHRDQTLTAVADASGRIFHDTFQPEAHDVGVRFYLTAAGSASQAQTTFTDATIPTTTVVSSLPSPSAFGQLVTFTATVTETATGFDVNQGEITFTVGPLVSGPHTVTAGQASFSSSALLMGPHAVTAVYSDSAAAFDPSTAEPVTHTVGRAATTTMLASVPVSSVFGQTVVFTATVAPVVPGLGTITGTVTFRDGGTTFGSATLNAATGQAVLATTSLALGDRAITAEYLPIGNLIFDTSIGGMTHTVGLAPTTTTLTSSPNPSVYGQEVTLRAKVAPVAPGAPRTLSFLPPAVYDAGTGTTTYSTATGDFNGDGFLDLATTSRDTNQVSVALGDGSFLANGTGGFRSPVLYSVGTSPVHVVAADLNFPPDGKLDLVTANQGSANISILRGNGDGTFGDPLPPNPRDVATGSVVGLARPSGIAVGDFNTDGKPDIAIANASADPTAGQNNVTVRIGDGMLGFGTSAVSTTVSTTPVHIVTADFNQDKVLDLATANAGVNNVSILRGTGTGSFTPLPNVTMAGTGSFPRAVVVGDFNSDGRPDLATANFGTAAASGTVSFRLNTGLVPGAFPGSATTLSLSTSSDASLIRPDFIVAGDFNGDGPLDLAVTYSSSTHSFVSILIGSGSGSGTGAFASPVRFDSGAPGRRLAAADLNGDGTLDLAIPTLTSNVNVLLNIGTSPTGTVQFMDGGVLIGEAEIDAFGIASMATPTLAAGTHMLIARYLGDPTYGGSIGNHTHVVTPAPVTLTADTKMKTYGDADPELTYQITSGALVGEDTFTGSLVRAPGENVGPYAIQQGTLALSSNYQLTFIGAVFTIGPRLAVWTTNPNSKIYGDADPSPLTTGSGTFLASDGVTATYTRAPGETVAGGPYHITATLSAGVAGALDNYTIINDGADFTITPRAATWTTNNNSKTYGQADPNPLTTGSGTFLASDGVTATYTRVPGETVAGGPYHITAALNSATPDALGNYTITNSGASFTITPALLTVSANDTSRAFGDANPTFTVSYSGFVLGQDPSVLGGALTFTTPATTASDVGTYAITPAGLTSGNYAITFLRGTLTVTPLAVPVLSLTKSVDKWTADPGDALVYTLTYRNTGGVAATGVTIRDVVPANTTFVSASHGGTNTAGTVRWTIGNVAAEAEGSVTLTVRVSSTLKCRPGDREDDKYRDDDKYSDDRGGHRHGDGDKEDEDHRFGRKGHHRGDGCSHDDEERCTTVSVRNQGSIRSTETSRKPSNTVTTSVKAVKRVPVLSLQKTVNATTAVPGATLVYTLTYSNTGNGAATGVTISDVVPANTTFVSANHGGTNTAGTVKWTLGNVAAKAKGSVTLTVRVSSTLECRPGDDEDSYSDNRGGHRHGDGDWEDEDHRFGWNGHHRGDGCSHDDEESCTVSVPNQGAIRSSETPLKSSNTVTTKVTVKSREYEKPRDRR